MDGVGAVGGGSRARAAAYRVVVTERVVAKGEVGHGSLARRGDSQRAQHYVNDTLRCFHVSPDNRRALGGIGLLGRIQQALRKDNSDGSENSGVKRNVFVDET